MPHFALILSAGGAALTAVLSNISIAGQIPLSGLNKLHVMLFKAFANITLNEI